MTKIAKIIIATITTMVLFLSFSTTTFALGEYTPLAPLPGTTITSGDNTGQTNLETYIPNVFRLSMGIAAVMAFVMITFGGIMYATSDAISGKSQGREYVTNAVWGLLLVVGAWALLNTINPKILNFSLDINQINITNAGGPTTGTVAGRPMTQAEIDADTAVRARLVGVTVNNGPCLQGQTIGCTNVNGLPDNAIRALNSVKTTCNCDVVITGGTEGGHATHGVGEDIVDIRPSAELNAYIGITSPRDGATIEKTAPNGSRVIYTFETAGGNPNGTSTGDHWHVVIR